MLPSRRETGLGMVRGRCESVYCGAGKRHVNKVGAAVGEEQEAVHTHRSLSHTVYCSQNLGCETKNCHRVCYSKDSTRCVKPRLGVFEDANLIPVDSLPFVPT